MAKLGTNTGPVIMTGLAMISMKIKARKIKKKVPNVSESNQNKSEKANKTEINELYKNVEKLAELDDFITWLALPTELRNPIDQREFSKQYNVNEDTITNWKKRPGFYEEVIRRRRLHFKDDAANVIKALERKCLKEGSGADVKVFLNYTEDLKDKTEVDVSEELKEALKKIKEVLPD